MAWKKPEEETPSVSSSTGTMSPPSGPASRPADPQRASNGGAVIGSSLVIKGEVTGNEDLFIHGQIDGKVTLHKNSVVIGREGRVKADIYARSIRVEGQVNGDLYGEGEVVIHKSGQVRGNITAPQVSLENGSKFKGAIDMEPGDDRGSATEGKVDGKSRETPVTSSVSPSPPSPTPTGLTSGAGKEAATASSRN